MYIFKNLSFIELLQKMHTSTPKDQLIEIHASKLEKGILLYSNNIITGFQKLENLDDFTRFCEDELFYEKHGTDNDELYSCQQKIRNTERMHGFQVIPYAPLIIVNVHEKSVFAQILIEEAVVWIDVSKYRWYLVK